MTADAVSVLTPAVGSLQADVLEIAPVGLAIGAVVFAIGFGWRFVRSLISESTGSHHARPDPE